MTVLVTRRSKNSRDPHRCRPFLLRSTTCTPRPSGLALSTTPAYTRAASDRSPTLRGTGPVICTSNVRGYLPHLSILPTPIVTNILSGHPTAAEHNALTSLLSRLQDSSVGSPELHTFLTSDLGAPLPLHISLSRPFVLATHERDVFVRRLVDAVRGCGVAPFELWPASPEPVGWHRSQESARSFLVLRVRSNSRGGGNSNPELVRLLSRCNELVASVGQLELYQWASETASGKEGEGEDSVGGAFHVSIAWSLGELTAELQRQTADVVAEQELTVGMPQIRIRVDAIKAKIGNVVTNISLPDAAKRSEAGNESKQASLFGI